MTRRDVPGLGPRELNRATLARQMLLAREPIKAAAAIRRLVGLQAQLPRPPFVGLWTRLDAFRREDLLRAVHRRQVVRVPAMRATLHLMTAADYVAFRAAVQPALTRAAQSNIGGRTIRADQNEVDMAARDFFRARPATFDALRAYFKTKFAGSDERALSYNVRLRVPLVQIPGGEPWGFGAACDFALAEDWLGCEIRTAPAPAHELVRRYLAAFGPATVADAQTWSGVPRLAEAFETLRPKLVTFRDARNRELFDLPGAPRPPADSEAPVRFLPEYDNLLLAFQDRTRVVPDEHRPRLITRNLQIPAVFLIDGMVAGLWRTERAKNRATLLVEAFGRLSKATRDALEAEGDSLLRFVEEGSEPAGVRYVKR